MRRFYAENNAADFAELERKARSACLVFRDQELPPACIPSRARIGFEIDRNTGCARLYVDRGIRYCGLNTTMRAWFERGEISFANFGALQRWITSELKDEFERSLDAVPPVATIIPKHEPPSKGAADRSATTLGTYSSSQPAAESPRPEPFFGRVIIFAIKQLARTYGLDVISVEDAIVGAIASNLASRGEQPCEAVFDEFFAGPFALAATQGSPAITLHAGHPVICKTISKDQE